MLRARIIPTFLTFCYVLFYILGQSLGDITLIAASLAFAFLAFIFASGLKIDAIGLLLAVSIVSVIILLINDTYPFQRLCFNLMFISANILLSQSVIKGKIDALTILKLSIASISVFFIYCQINALLQGMPVYSFMDGILVGFSYNYISGLLILAMSLYYAYSLCKSSIVRYEKTLALITCVICFLLYGRSGIIFSILLFAIAFRDWMGYKKPVRALFSTFVILGMVTILSNNVELIVDVAQQSKFKEGFDSPRTLMLQEYMALMDFSGFMTGVDITKIPIIAAFNYNPHNSYLNLHAMSGILGILFVLAILLLLCCRMGTNFFIVCLLLIYMGRGALDTIIFPGVFDFVFFSVLIHSTGTRKSFNVSKYGGA